MHFHMHGRGCGPRGGSAGHWRRGPFEIEWDFGPRHGGGGGGGGRARRMFDGGELRLVLLRMIADAPRHGYELIKAIEELTGGAYAPSPGVIYPTLTMLGDMGLIEEQASEGARKRFAVTAEGEAHLAENAETVEALMARLGDLGAERDRVGGMRTPVRRAMGNLREAVQGRVARGDLGEDMLHAIAALIDEAAQKIERLK